ncbi:dihydrolipoyllysine-residue succinyltransferase [Siphonobacter sp. BAB-5405]|uniref:2-oxoglutarate dehydrogenase complex dihydrolipoyllysine-residue succinyltransferase n=1 Tax=Siphonobacter sp. BAB-5405 TaxID=1864825 RepID=UPI000C80F7CA|nr:2-oxoglutarate dehydrogenase complex dihydrolipoyllysine-residue succinyltransferase [Siphonobacter sp. BAB-5405]PMD96720.1 dihydrolipoyllysine-residue succinyltransferase [Siphonobacter sp. BAB-5405]
MAIIEMKVPVVGESVTEVTIATWNKKDGDTVKMDEVLCELESDKATFELPAEAAGVLRILAKEGDTLAIGAPICSISTDGAAPEAPQEEAPAAVSSNGQAPEAAPAPAPEAKAEETKTIEVKIPVMGESVTEATIANWNKKEGDFVKMDEILCELESDKATFELPAEAAGTLHIIAEPGSTLEIGAVVATITVGAGAPAAAPSAPAAAPASGGSSAPVADKASGVTPVAAAILADKGINPKDIQGSGEGGKITKADALKATSAPTPAAKAEAPKAAAAAQPAAAPATTGGRAERRQRMTSLRKTIARRLVAVKNETAMLTTFNEVDMQPIMELRSKFKDKFKEKHGVGLGFMSFFAKAVCVALKEFQAVNASIDGDEIVYHDYVDISVAVSTERGLVVPILRNADQLSFAGIEKGIIELAVKARDNKLTIEDMSGGTFTITNGGVFGSMMSTPIINAPQVAILGMHNIIERPVVVNKEIVIRPMMYIALSYDHRIIDGKESVSFLVRVKQLLEDPARLLLDV